MSLSLIPNGVTSSLVWLFSSGNKEQQPSVWQLLYDVTGDPEGNIVRPCLFTAAIFLLVVFTLTRCGRSQNKTPTKIVGAVEVRGRERDTERDRKRQKESQRRRETEKQRETLSDRLGLPVACSKVKTVDTKTNDGQCTLVGIARDTAAENDIYVPRTGSNSTSSESERVERSCTPNGASAEIKPVSTPQIASSTSSTSETTDTRSYYLSGYEREAMGYHIEEIFCVNLLASPKGGNKKDARLFNDTRAALASKDSLFVSASQELSPEKQRNHKRMFKRARPIERNLHDVSRVGTPSSLISEKTDTSVGNPFKGASRRYSPTNCDSAVNLTFERHLPECTRSTRDSTVNLTFERHLPEFTRSTREQEQLGGGDTDETDPPDNAQPKRCKREGYKTVQEPVCLRYCKERAYDLGDIGRHNVKYLPEEGLTSIFDLIGNDKEVVDSPDNGALFANAFGKRRSCIQKGKRCSQKRVQTARPRRNNKATQTDATPHMITLGLQTNHSCIVRPPSHDASTSTPDGLGGPVDEPLNEAGNTRREIAVRCNPAREQIFLNVMMPTAGSCHVTWFDGLRARIMESAASTETFPKAQKDDTDTKDSEVD